MTKLMGVALHLSLICASAWAFTTRSSTATCSTPCHPYPHHRHHKSYTAESATSLFGVVAEEGDGQRKFMYMTEEQDQLLLEKGNHEASLMTKVAPLKPNKVKVRIASGGFGKASKEDEAKVDKKEKLMAEAKAHAKALEKEGLVRIDSALPSELADALKTYLVDLRARAIQQVEEGQVQDSQERFADVLLNQNRCDLKIPFGPKEVDGAMDHLLNHGVLRPLIEFMFDKYGGGGSESSLYELNCFMSNSGARRQLVHSDNACVDELVGLHPDEPVMLTCFVALQDTDATMGPTTWIPRTHNTASHREFYEVGEEQKAKSSKDNLLKSKKAVLGTLPKGGCVIFDPRVLHCAGANNYKDPNETRAMFYFSFKNPRVDSPGCPSCSGYGIVNADIPMHALCDELDARISGNGNSPRLDAISCSP